MIDMIFTFITIPFVVVIKHFRSSELFEAVLCAVPHLPGLHSEHWPDPAVLIYPEGHREHTSADDPSVSKDQPDSLDTTGG